MSNVFFDLFAHLYPFLLRADNNRQASSLYDLGVQGPTPDDEDRTPGYPPRDENGMFYYAGYVQESAIKGVSNVCGSSEEAVRLAEQTIQSQITWESDQQQP
jgi:hypothetical protein